MTRHLSKNQHNSEHGTTQSYVIGFVLSIIFTLIPYYMVVNQKITGTPLLVTILSFAVLQAIIQITFFLHLRRGPKPKWNLFFFVATVAVILIVVGGSIVIINNLHYNMAPPDQVAKLVNDEGIYSIDGKKTGACVGLHPDHQVIIKSGQVYPQKTNAQLCDTITFINDDNAIRIIGFGHHPNDTPYAGNQELPLGVKQSARLTLSQAGSYDFHDHLHEETAGTFTVNP